MAPNSLSPASIVISYHSAFSAHKMTIPTKEWIPVGFSTPLGGYQAWDSSSCDADTMVDAFIAKLKKLFLPSTSFDEVTIYTQATPTSPNIPRAGKQIAVVGTSAGTGESAAVSATFNMKTDDNGTVKLVCLDIPIGSNWFAPLFPADFTSDLTDIFDQLADNTNAWAGRDDHRPDIFRTVTFDLNDKLQKMYFAT